jgi:uncharacterized protein (TIGR02611 family)
MPTGDARGRERRSRPEPRSSGDHHVLVNRSEDRWEWRRKIRADPRKAGIYRVGVAIAGAMLIILGVLTGPLPGPGGIPLVLLGIAVWASEFAWAHRLMKWFKLQLHRFRSWSRPRQVLAWLIFFAVLGLIGYGYLVITGVPVWLPEAPTRWLEHLPGL